MCVVSVLSTVVTAVCIAECHTRALPAMVPCLSCLYAEHMCGLVRVNSLTSEVCSAQVRLSGKLGPSAGSVYVIHSWFWEFKHPPFSPYCAFLLGHFQSVFPDTSPTCVLGGECFGMDEPVRAASWAPIGTFMTFLRYLPSFAEIPNFSLSAVVAE